MVDCGGPNDGAARIVGPVSAGFECEFGPTDAAGALRGLSVAARVERYGSRATVSFESLHIRIPLKFCEHSAKLSHFFRNSEKIRKTSQHFLECSAKFRKK